MSYVQLSEGRFQVAHPLGLWSQFCGVVEFLFRYGYAHLHLHLQPAGVCGVARPLSPGSRACIHVRMHATVRGTWQPCR